MPLQHTIRQVKAGYILECFSCDHKWTVKEDNVKKYIVGSTRTYTGEEDLFECPNCQKASTVK